MHAPTRVHARGQTRGSPKKHVCNEAIEADLAPWPGRQALGGGLR